MFLIKIVGKQNVSIIKIHISLTEPLMHKGETCLCSFAILQYDISANCRYNIGDSSPSNAGAFSIDSKKIRFVS